MEATVHLSCVAKKSLTRPYLKILKTGSFITSLINNSRFFPGLDSELQQIGSPEDDLDVDSFPLSFSQLDHLTSSSIGETTLQGDAIWQCKSPNQSGQVYQNLLCHYFL